MALGTGLADLGTDLADSGVTGRNAQHKICTGGTELDAVLEDSQMAWLNVPPTLLNTVLKRLGTDRVAIRTASCIPCMVEPA